MKISEPTLVVLLKQFVRKLISSKKCFDESDEIKFLTKISCYTVDSDMCKLENCLSFSSARITMID